MSCQNSYFQTKPLKKITAQFGNTLQRVCTTTVFNSHHIIVYERHMDVHGFGTRWKTSLWSPSSTELTQNQLTLLACVKKKEVLAYYLHGNMAKGMWTPLLIKPPSSCRMDCSLCKIEKSLSTSCHQPLLKQRVLSVFLKPAYSSVSSREVLLFPLCLL